ncbi:cupin domain-containing protein [Candidatus Paraluminiphilus aquimaris]|nr:cupin domain-containing protein [Candidatus Paraluminiphilus aquimaris]
MQGARIAIYNKGGFWVKLTALMSLISLSTLATAETVHPAKLSSTELAGYAFKNPNTIVTETPTGKIHDLTSLKSSDGKFASGMYSAGKSRFDITEPYGVDEFMFFLEGSVTLTSDDGTQMTVNAGEAVTIPKEWTGVWETEGYRKIWVIYSSSGEGL